MHEVTIATSLVEQVCEYARSNGAERVTRIDIRLGALRGIARSLQFCFVSATEGTLCDGATLCIEEVPLTVMCTHCNAVKVPAALYNFRCPDCGYPTPKVLTGREMDLISLGLVPAQPEPAHPNTESEDARNSARPH